MKSAASVRTRTDIGTSWIGRGQCIGVSSQEPVLALFSCGLFNAESQGRRVRVTAAQAGLAIRSEPSRANASAESFLGLPAAGVSELESGGSNWESRHLGGSRRRRAIKATKIAASAGPVPAGAEVTLPTLRKDFEICYNITVLAIQYKCDARTS